MTAGFSVSLDGLGDLIHDLEALDAHEVYGAAATDAAEIAAGSVQSYATRAGVPDDVVDRISPTVSQSGVIGFASSHPDHERYESGDLDTPPTGFWRNAMLDNDEYEPHFNTLLAAHVDARLR